MSIFVSLTQVIKNPGVSYPEEKEASTEKKKKKRKEKKRKEKKKKEKKRKKRRDGPTKLKM